MEFKPIKSRACCRSRCYQVYHVQDVEPRVAVVQDPCASAAPDSGNEFLITRVMLEGKADVR